MTTERSRTATELTVPALLGLVVCAFFHRAMLGERFFAVDFYQTFVPLRSILAEAWAHGIPAWTGRLGNGAPLLANPAYGVFYPPNLLYLGADAARSMTVLTVAHFIVGGVGAWRLARRFELSRAAAWVAAAGFVLSGPAVSSTAYPNLSWPLAWLPWALVAHDEAVRGRTGKGIAGLALCWFSMVSMGDPVVLAAALLGSALLASRDIWSRPARSIAAPGVAALLALVLSSPLLVAILRYAPQSVRGAGFKADGIVQWSLHPLLLVGTFLPNPFGDPSLSGPAGFWADALAFDRGKPLLAGLYVGGLTLSLAVLGALRRSRYRGILLAWLVVLVALALGKYGPIYPVLRDMPGFDALRYPTKWIVPAMLPLALLAASGLDAIAASASAATTSRRAPFVFLGVLSVLALLSACSMAGLETRLAALSSQPQLSIDRVPLPLHVRSTWLSATSWSAIPVALALLTLVFGARTRAASALLPIVAALVTLDVALANPSLAPTVRKDFYDVPAAAAAIFQDPAGHERVFVEDIGQSGRPLYHVHPPASPEAAARPHREGLAAYVGASVGLNLAFNPDTEAFSPIAYARAGVLTRGAPQREKLMLLGAAGATHIVTYQPFESPSLEPIATIPGAYNLPLLVYRNPLAMPRARIVPRLTAYDSDAGFIHLVQSAPDDLFRHTALVERQALQAAGLADGNGALREGGTATIVQEDGRSLIVQVAGPGGYLIVSDTLAPGWTAQVDDLPATLLRADLAFRAVPVPEGTHRVAMLYNPW